MSPQSDVGSSRTRIHNRPHLTRGAEVQRPWLAVLGQAGLIGGALAAYFSVRGLTRGAEDLARANADDLLQLERSLGLDIERWAQQSLLDHDWLIQTFNSIYVWGYWPPLIVALVYFWFLDQRRFTVLRNALFISGAVGLVVFALYPVAPPRMLAGFTDTIAESRRGMFIAQPPGFVNKFAALPSFHVGWLALAGCATARGVQSQWRVLAHMPAVLMGFAVVFTANHYIVDIVAGVAICVGALRLAEHLERHPQPMSSPPTLLPAGAALFSHERPRSRRNAA